MTNREKIIVSEFVSYGHPDKIADFISDAILDEFLRKDKNVRCGVETLVKDNVVVLGGEIKSTSTVDYDSIVRAIYRDLNFPPNHNLHPDNIKIINLIGKQSPEISKGVDQTNGIIGAGDQGFVVGYASNESPLYLPLGVYISKKLCQAVVNDLAEYSIGPDVKTQAIIGGGKLKSLLISTMHQCEVETMRRIVKRFIMSNDMDLDDKIFMQQIKNNDFQLDINPSNSWKIGGPVSDCGVTGRKIVVDQYGGYANVGGGAFSGKDSSKVDRSAAYAARYIAKNIVASGLAKECKVTISYMIGVAQPCSVDIKTFGTSLVSKGELTGFIENEMDLTPQGIITKFKLQKPVFAYTAKNGHFGNSVCSWEQTDMVDKLIDTFPF
jgi:S-adenosylmethionine synthetase